MLDLWYKNAIIYCLDVKTFMDADGNGFGDFTGLADRLDHLEALGVTTVWLNPFYPTPNRDNGYDVSEFYGVDSRFGTLGTFVDFSREARDRGMRVVVDLVVNHTSIDHPWFQSARQSKDSPYRDWYVWCKDEPEDITEGIIFPGVQDSVWTYDEMAGEWYLHRFYAHQADLNISNPLVREEIMRIMGFWLELGVSGFRVDAVPHLVEFTGLKEEPDRDPLLLLSEMRNFLSWRQAGSILLAEANVERSRAPAYFGGREFDEADRMHMVFDFPLNQKLYLALARGDAGVLADSLRERPGTMPLQAQWAVFLRNHDELNLDKLTEAEREEVFAAFGPDEDMQIYERGLRRRLAPMLGGDTRRIGMLHSLLFALPGTPVMWYGDEIGMGEDLSLDERNAVRLPMQWADERNGGFSLCGDDLVRPVLAEGPYGYQKVNVSSQNNFPDTLMGLVQRLIRTRRACPEIGWGTWESLETGCPSVLGLMSSWRGNAVVTLHNLAAEAVRVTLDIEADHLMPLAGDGSRMLTTDAPIDLGPYGFRWFRVNGERR